MYDSEVTVDEIVSVLFYLVYLKHIEITVNSPKDGLTAGSYTLRLIKLDTSNLRKYERTFLDAIFSGKDTVSWDDFNSSISSLFYLGAITFQMQQELQRRGFYFFSKNFLDVTYEQEIKRIKANILDSICLGFLNVGLGFSKYVTKRGLDIIPKVNGFKKYLEIAEKERIDFHTDPNNKNLYVSDFAPYAIALGVNTVWGDELMGTTTVSCSGFLSCLCGSEPRI